MQRRSSRVAATLLAVAWISATEARADWLVTPFLGATFAGNTNLFNLELGVGSSQLVLGGSGAWQSRDRILGIEVDFAWAPRFFERENCCGLVINSNLTTLMGNVIAAAPLSVTRESLRPYLVGGAGLIHVAAQDALGIFPVDGNLLGLDLGGGAVGFISDRTGFRFDLRHFRTLRGSEETLTGESRNRLSFWRFTVGVTMRY